MTTNRDSAIWATLSGEAYDIARADLNTTVLPDVSTNFDPDKSNHNLSYSYGKDAIEKFTVAPGYKIELFASEEEFPDLANPVQLSFDDKERKSRTVILSITHSLCFLAG